MNRVEQAPSSRLPGSGAIFMSASVPTPDRDPDFLRDRACGVLIQDAVISLTRSVLAHGGRLIFGGHPSVTPLVAMVAADYLPPAATADDERGPEPGSRVTIYQSNAFVDHAPPETYELGGLELARLVWTEAVDGERFDPTVKGQVPCPKSLARMRRQMITETRPVAMACIGGMEGIVHEAQLWNELRPDAPIWAMVTTGGASPLLREHGIRNVREPDREIIEELGLDPTAPPYDLIMNRLIRGLFRSP